MQPSLLRLCILLDLDVAITDMAPAPYDSSPVERASAQLHQLRPTHPCNYAELSGSQQTASSALSASFGSRNLDGGQSKDPLRVFPPEVILGILKCCPGLTLARLEAVSKSWLAFLTTHSAQVWHAAAVSQEERRGEVGRPRRLGVSVKSNSLARALCNRWSCEEDTWSGVASWKDFFKHQAMLTSYMARGIKASGHPPRQRLLGVPGSPNVSFWRMRPDYVLRLLICSAENGGLYVLDMDTSELLWSLPAERVEPFAHLEYSSGILALNTGTISDNSIDIWQLKDLVDLDSAGLAPDPADRGEFKKLGHLSFDVRIQGWHLRGRTLCVVSPQGRAWIYDLTTGPNLRHAIKIAPGAIGHLDQDDTTVMYSMGDGYHIYDKATGAKLGEINPHTLVSETADDAHDDGQAPFANVFAIQREEHDQAQTCLFLAPKQAEDAEGEPQDAQAEAHEEESDSDSATFDSEDEQSDDDIDLDFEDIAANIVAHIEPEGDEWGVGMICGSFIVGFSRNGKVLVISDWRKVLSDASEARNVAALIECDVGWIRHSYMRQGDEQRRHRMHNREGGWMSLGLHEGNPRVAIEIRDHIYILPLPHEGQLPDCSPTQLPVLAIRNGAPAENPDFWRGASFMHLGEDHLLTTYANPVFPDADLSTAFDPEREAGRSAVSRRFPSRNGSPKKCARFVHFAPWPLAGDRQISETTCVLPHAEIMVQVLPSPKIGPVTAPKCPQQGNWGELRIRRRKQVLARRLQWQRQMARLHNWGCLWIAKRDYQRDRLGDYPEISCIETITSARMPSLDEGIIQSYADAHCTLGDEDVDQAMSASLEELLRPSGALEDARRIERPEQDDDDLAWPAVKAV